MTYYYKFESGEYSDYREAWYGHPKKLTYNQIAVMLREALPEIVQRMKHWDKIKADECQRLFGTKEWPYPDHCKTPEQKKKFYAWRDRWSGFNFEDEWLKAIGMRALQPYKEIDTLDDIHDERSALAFLTALEQKVVK